MRFSSITASVNGGKPEVFDLDSFWGWFIVEEVAKMPYKDIKDGLRLEFSINGEKLNFKTSFDRIQKQWEEMKNDRDFYQSMLKQIVEADAQKKSAIEEAAEYLNRQENED